MTRFEHDPQSGAFYIRIREGEYRETIPLADPGFGAGVDVDAEGNVLGFEFLSFDEYAELVARSGGTLEIPDVLEGTATVVEESPRSQRLAHEDLHGKLEAAIMSLSPRQQQIVQLYYYDGLRRNEIALELGISKSAVARHQRDALIAIRKKVVHGDERSVSRPLEEQLEEYFAGIR